MHSPSAADPWRYVLLGDGQSPHLLKWARTLNAVGGPALQLHVVSSRGLLPGFDGLIEPARRLRLDTRPDVAGGNARLLLHLPRVARWLRQVQPHVLHAHYLTSHGTVAALAQRFWGVPGALVGSAWGSDVLVTPQRSRLMRALTAWVLRACTLTTSDSHHMADRMRQMGAGRVEVFPFGLEEWPTASPSGAPSDATSDATSGAPTASQKDPWLFFSNRALEPWYGIDRVIDLFAAVAHRHPPARLVIAHEGSLFAELQQQVSQRGLDERVRFVGRLAHDEQADWYARAQWHLSLPHTDSVSVSVLEGMAHGCIPVLSDLPANRELVEHGVNGWIFDAPPRCASSSLPHSTTEFLQALPALQLQARSIAQRNREWVSRHGVFAPCVQAFLEVLGFQAKAATPPHRVEASS